MNRHRSHFEFITVIKLNCLRFTSVVERRNAEHENRGLEKEKKNENRANLACSLSCMYRAFLYTLSGFVWHFRKREIPDTTFVSLFLEMTIVFLRSVTNTTN